MKLKALRGILSAIPETYDDAEVVLEGSDHSYDRVTHADTLPAYRDTDGDFSECDIRLAPDRAGGPNATVLVLR